MTVSSSANTAEFQGNGTTTVFPLPFRFFDNEDVTAYLIDNTSFAQTTLTLGVNYTLIGAGEPEEDGNPVSQLTMLVAPPFGQTLVVERIMSPVQETEIINQARFYPEIHENVFDRLTMLIQQAINSVRTALSLDAARRFFDARGFQIKNLGAPTAANDATTKTYVDTADSNLSSRIDSLSAGLPGTNYAFPWSITTTQSTKTLTPGFEFASATLYLNGIAQTYGRSFSVAGNQIVLAEAIPAGTEVYAILGQNVVPDGFATVEDVAVVAEKSLTRDIARKITSDSSAMFLREKYAEVGFRDSYYDQILSTYGYSYLYPQQLAIDTSASEIWIMKRSASGSNSWAWVWVYDSKTLEIKTVFSTGEGWKESIVLRSTGGIRYMYTVGNNNDIIRINVSSLPDPLSIAPVADRYAVNAYSQIAFDGSHWYVQDVASNLGTTRRHRFKIYDADLSTLSGRLELPLDSVGTIQSYINNFPHMQAVCCHKGTIYAAVGGAYVPASNSADMDRPYYLQGLHAFTETGEKLSSALCSPDGFRAKIDEITGYPSTCVENEGVATNGSDLFALWITLGPSERVQDSYLGRGVLITIEQSLGKNAVDFSPAASNVKSAIDLSWFSSTVHASSSQLLNPVTNEALSSFPLIIDMMKQLGIARYSFGGTNQALSDMNGLSTTVSGRLVEFVNVNGNTFLVRISDTSGNVVQYGISGTSQLGPFNNGGEFGSNSNGYYFKHSNGELTCILTVSPGLACTTARGAIFGSDAFLWTYPFPFVSDRPIVEVNACNGLRWGGATGLPGYESCSVILFATASDATARTFQVKAQGRWK